MRLLGNSIEVISSVTNKAPMSPGMPIGNGVQENFWVDSWGGHLAL